MLSFLIGDLNLVNVFDFPWVWISLKGLKCIIFFYFLK